MDVLRQPDERHERDRTVTLRWRTGEMVADGYGCSYRSRNLQRWYRWYDALPHCIFCGQQRG